MMRRHRTKFAAPEYYAGRICPTCDAGDPTSVVPFADCECEAGPTEGPPETVKQARLEGGEVDTFKTEAEHWGIKPEQGRLEMGNGTEPSACPLCRSELCEAFADDALHCAVCKQEVSAGPGVCTECREATPWPLA